MQICKSEIKSGIYKLYWPGTPYYYIGSSLYIDKRYKAHINGLNAKKHNNKLIQAFFDINGIPSIEIIELCEDKTKLPVRELYHFSKTDHKYTLNIVMQKTPKAHSSTDFQKKLQCI